MKMNEIRSLAKSLGIKFVREEQIELIKEIQSKQGNFDCFGTAMDYCDQLECLFREPCLSEKH